MFYKRVNIFQVAQDLIRIGIKATPGQVLDALLAMEETEHVEQARQAYAETPAIERFNEEMDYHVAIRQALATELGQGENDSDELHMLLSDVSDVYVGAK